MQKIICFFCAILLSFPVFNANAQDPAFEENSFSLSGQLRSRFEFRDGAFRPLSKNEDPAFLVLNRIRLNADYSYKDQLKTRISIQNVNLWGQGNPVQSLDKSDNNLSVFEAWADVKIYKELRAKVGRQTISLDDERIFGLGNWTNSSRAHDALSLSFEKKKFQIQTYFAFNQNYDPLYGNNVNNPSGNLYNSKEAQSYKLMQTLWANFNIEDHSKISFLISNVGFQHADSLQVKNEVNYLQTMGLNYFLKTENIFGHLTGYYQFGESASGKSTGAYLLSAGVGTNIRNQFSVGIGADYLSGNTMSAPSATNKSFQPLFGTGHKFYGNMDYFYAGNPYKDIGLIDIYLNLKYNFSSQFKAGLDVHAFSSPTNLNTGVLNFDKNLGQEVDLNFEYKVNKFVELSAGYSTYFATSSLLMIKNVTNEKRMQNWAWISLNVHPTFFKTLF